jgi:trk system potassium uptake protein TrkH
MGFFKLVNLSPARFLAGGFALMIATGTFLLSLPFATVTGEISFINALFTATSAVCVTGLVVVDTGTYFSLFGQLVIMFLILGGALGFMTSATLIFVILGKNITLKDRLIIKEALNTDSIQGVVHLILTIAKMAVITILLGSIFLGFRFFPQLGWKRGLLFSVFHSISAFGNAGFDLIGDFEGLTLYADDFLVSGTIMALFIVGGLGFTVILDIFQRKKPARYSLHSKMVLLFTVFLLVSGTLFILFLEYNNPATLGDVQVGSKIFRALFTAATPRTAGFNVVPTEALKPASLFYILILMFIGASPASTGGGVKTTTFALIVGAVRALLKGSDEVVFWEKRIPSTLILKALTIIFISIFLIFFIVFAMTIVENKPFLDLTFEVFSAFGTVGLSTGITPDLTVMGKTLLIITMYAGRLGPLTMLYALTRKFKARGVRYPEERILIG